MGYDAALVSKTNTPSCKASFMGSRGARWIEKCIPPDMRPKLNENICCDPFYGNKDLSLPHYNAETGEKLFDMPGDEPRRVSRRKLRNFLSQGIDVRVWTPNYCY
jgi:hypothetical protein